MKQNNLRSFFLFCIRYVLVPFLISAITFLQFQTSVLGIPFINSTMPLGILLWNLLTIWLLLVLLIGIVNRVHLAMLLWSFFAFVVSFANYFVLMYHGAPLTIHLLENIGTAMDVIGSYSLSLDDFSGLILAGFFACIALAVFSWYINKGGALRFSLWKRVSMIGIAAALLFGNIYFGVFGENAFKPKASVTFSWESAASEYGFIPLQLESHFQEQSFMVSPSDCSEESIRQLYESISLNKTHTQVSELPDIILILNECFFDLQNVVNLNMNTSPLSNYYNIEQAVTGYAVVPGMGGGTNRSEFELLTSTSLSLLPNQTPFQALDVAGQCSIVSFLEAYGYETYAAHCAKPGNYNRGYSYPALGFNHSFFVADFDGLEAYGNRAHTDSSVYKNLISWYKEDSSNPKFMYLLTYQNHGGWDQNSQEWDTVRVENDLGEYTSQVNEYLTSVSMSDAALVELLSYFETVDRPVIVCVVGDHAHSIAVDIADKSVPDTELNYLIRGTPFLIWSNYGLESQDMGYISLNYLAPKLLKTAGIPLSPFYDYQIDLMNDVPIITSLNSFYDKNMDMFSFDADGPMSAKVHNYLNMCYNNLQDNRFHPLFEPMDNIRLGA